MPVHTTFFYEFVHREVVARKVRSALFRLINLATNKEKHDKYIHDGSDKEEVEESSRGDMYCMIDRCFIPSSKTAKQRATDRPGVGDGQTNRFVSSSLDYAMRSHQHVRVVWATTHGENP